MDRFSPLFTNAEFGVVESRPAAAYSFLYPLGAEQLRNLAYFFEFDYSDQREPGEYAGGVAQEVVSWPDWTDEKRLRLDLFQTDSIVLITDTRACAQKPSFVLTGFDAKIYLGCDTAQTPRGVARLLGNALSEMEVHSLLEFFRDARLMTEMGGRFLSLAVWRNRVVAEVVANRRSTEVCQEPSSLLNVI